MHQYDELLDGRSGRATLVERAIRGEEDAFAALYERHALRAWRLAYALTGTTSDAVGVVSESFATTFTALRAERAAPLDFPALLLRTTRHRALDARRAHGDTLPPFEAPHQTLALATAFSSLPERWRSALWLNDVDDLSSAEVASVLELGSDAATAVYTRARKGLREQYLHADVQRSADRNCGRSVARLGAYVAGSLPGDEVDKLERHLRLCDSCTDRCTQLTALPSRLPTLVPPLPDMLEDDVRIAWAGAVATTTGLGLSRMSEKVLAGVAAVAAGVGVLGAALVSVSGSGGDDEAVAPIAPIVTELAAPRPPDMDLTIDLEPDRRSAASLTADDEFDGVVGASARNSADDAVIADLDEDPEAPATPIRGGAGVTPPMAPTAPPPAASDTGAALSVGADVGGVPIAVEVGETPGVTVGPISVGSQPSPGDETASVGGPLAPLAPVVEPVDETVGGLLGG